MSEHMNDAGLCYCGSLDCLGNVRVMLSDAQVKLFETRAGADQVAAELAQAQTELARAKATWLKYEQAAGTAQSELATLKASIETIEEVWREQVAGYMGDWAEDSLLNTLAAEFEFEATEEVNITITVEVSATITVPIGADVHTHDFDIDELEISTNEKGWSIDLGDAEISDISK